MLYNIEAERVRRGLSRDELAQTLGVKCRTLSNWITEKTDMPAAALVEMARLFGTSTDYLLEGADVSKEKEEANSKTE